MPSALPPLPVAPPAPSYGVEIGRLVTVPYPPLLQRDIIHYADIVHQYWSPGMRYQSVSLTAGEALFVHSAASWMLANFASL